MNLTSNGVVARFLPKSLSVFCAVLTLATLASSPRLVHAANPASGSIGPADTSVTYSNSATGTGAANGEGTCVEGVNCDSFTLTVNGQPADWTGKQLFVQISWAVPANDYDLYVHKGDLTGPVVGSSTAGAPETSEQTIIDPSSTGTGVYTIHTVYFATTPGADQPTGLIKVQAQATAGKAAYLLGGFKFSPNTTCAAPATTSDGEPSSRCDLHGNYYVGGIRGVPAGVDLWYFDLKPGDPLYDPNMRNPIYRGQPDSFTGQQATEVGADGGGDIDLAVGFADDLTSGVPTLAFSSLVAANISVGNSKNLGATFNLNPAGNGTGGVLIDDREWQEFYGGSKVYLLYRTLDPAVAFVQQSTDGGYTYGPGIQVGTIGQTGSIDVDQADGTVYVSGSNGVVGVGHPDATLGYPTSYTIYNAASDPAGVAHLFFQVKVAQDAATNGRGHGTVYCVYSNDKDVFYEYSLDQAAHWSKPIKVNAPLLGTKVHIFPRITTGSAPGSIAVVWYATTDTVNDDNADWKVYFAQSLNATAPLPTFREQVASDHVIHASNISENGLSVSGAANRNLLDYFQVTIDPVGAVEIGYTDDHNDFSGNVYVTRQIGGPSDVSKVNVPAPVEGSSLPPAQTRLAADGAQVVDPAQDVSDALLGVLPQNSPIDITEIKYKATRSTAPGGVVVTAAMKVSDLSTIPPLSTWRMMFAANAPQSHLSQTKLTTDGLSDRADQFFLEASTDQTGTQTFSWGTAVRNSDGSLTYTVRGAADSGSIVSATNTITVSVSASKLNPYVTHGSAISDGTVLAGLRGDSSTGNPIAQSDATRGGTQYTIP